MKCWTNSGFIVFSFRHDEKPCVSLGVRAHMLTNHWFYCVCSLHNVEHPVVLWCVRSQKLKNHCFHNVFDVFAVGVLRFLAGWPCWWLHGLSVCFCVPILWTSMRTLRSKLLSGKKLLFHWKYECFEHHEEQPCVPQQWKH